MNCKTEGFVVIRHNDIRDFEANLLSKNCNDVEIEPALPTNTVQGDEPRLDVREGCFWRKGRNALIGVRVTNANAKSQNKIML